MHDNDNTQRQKKTLYVYPAVGNGGCGGNAIFSHVMQHLEGYSGEVLIQLVTTLKQLLSKKNFSENTGLSKLFQYKQYIFDDLSSTISIPTSELNALIDKASTSSNVESRNSAIEFLNQIYQYAKNSNNVYALQLLGGFAVRAMIYQKSLEIENAIKSIQQQRDILSSNESSEQKQECKDRSDEKKEFSNLNDFLAETHTGTLTNEKMLLYFSEPLTRCAKANSDALFIQPTAWFGNQHFYAWGLLAEQSIEIYDANSGALLDKTAFFEEQTTPSLSILTDYSHFELLTDKPEEITEQDLIDRARIYKNLATQKETFRETQRKFSANGIELELCPQDRQPANKLRQGPAWIRSTKPNQASLAAISAENSDNNIVQAVLLNLLLSADAKQRQIEETDSKHPSDYRYLVLNTQYNHEQLEALSEILQTMQSPYNNLAAVSAAIDNGELEQDVFLQQAADAVTDKLLGDDFKAVEDKVKIDRLAEFLQINIKLLDEHDNLKHKSNAAASTPDKLIPIIVIKQKSNKYFIVVDKDKADKLALITPSNAQKIKPNKPGDDNKDKKQRQQISPPWEQDSYQKSPIDFFVKEYGFENSALKTHIAENDEKNKHAFSLLLAKALGFKSRPVQHSPRHSLGTSWLASTVFPEEKPAASSQIYADDFAESFADHLMAGKTQFEAIGLIYANMIASNEAFAQQAPGSLLRHFRTDFTFNNPIEQQKFATFFSEMLTSNKAAKNQQPKLSEFTSSEEHLTQLVHQYQRQQVRENFHTHYGFSLKQIDAALGNIKLDCKLITNKQLESGLYPELLKTLLGIAEDSFVENIKQCLTAGQSLFYSIGFALAKTHEKEDDTAKRFASFFEIIFQSKENKLASFPSDKLDNLFEICNDHKAFYTNEFCKRYGFKASSNDIVRIKDIVFNLTEFNSFQYFNPAHQEKLFNYLLVYALVPSKRSKPKDLTGKLADHVGLRSEYDYSIAAQIAEKLTSNAPTNKSISYKLSYAFALQYQHNKDFPLIKDQQGQEDFAAFVEEFYFDHRQETLSNFKFTSLYKKYQKASKTKERAYIQAQTAPILQKIQVEIEQQQNLPANPTLFSNSAGAKLSFTGDDGQNRVYNLQQTDKTFSFFTTEKKSHFQQTLERAASALLNSHLGEKAKNGTKLKITFIYGGKAEDWMQNALLALLEKNGGLKKENITFTKLPSSKKDKPKANNNKPNRPKSANLSPDDKNMNEFLERMMKGNSVATPGMNPPS